MTVPLLIVPINSEKMIIPLKSAGADILYSDYKNFLKDGRFSKSKLVKFIKLAHSMNLQFYLYFDYFIQDNELTIIKNIIDELSNLNIDGIMVNDFSIMEIIKHKKVKELKFNVHLDSGLNLHNIAGCELLKSWKATGINITEEIYLKNVSRIKKYTGNNICITVNEAVWLLNYAINWGIDLFKLAGDYNNIDRLCHLTLLLKETITDVKGNKGVDNIKIEEIRSLFDHSKPNRHYQVDHFTRTIKKFSGSDFEFTGNIKIFRWEVNKVIPEVMENNASRQFDKVKIRLRLTKLSQLQAVEDYIIKNPENKIDIIEYGDIIDPSDLAKLNYTKIIYNVKQMTRRHDIKLYLTTPKILIERDFERVVDTTKYLSFRDPQPECLVVNNLGIWRVITNSRKFNDIKIELGYGLNISNSLAVNLFNDMREVDGVNIPHDLTIEQIKLMTGKLKIKEKSIIILGTSQLVTSGLCPLNNDIAVISRLQCKAPCQKANFAVVDPTTKEMLPMALDGFCRLHLVHSYVYDQLKSIYRYLDAGITDFIVDLTALPPEMVEPLLDRYFQAIRNPEKYEPVRSELVRYQHESEVLEKI